MLLHDVSNGAFNDLYVGDTFTADYGNTTIKFRIMDVDPYWGIEESGIADTHHLLIVPDNPLEYDKMNPEAINLTGYKGSYMFNEVIPSIDKKLEAIFGKHLLSYNEIVSTDNKDGTELVSVKSILMNQLEIFGFKDHDHISGLLTRRISGFRMLHGIETLHNDRGKLEEWYERDCCGSSRFFCVFYGVSNIAQHADTKYCIRPRFIIG
jgi:hypothetical protein